MSDPDVIDIILINDARKNTMYHRNIQIGINERANYYLEKINKCIEFACENGGYNTSTSLHKEIHNQDEIYGKVLESVIAKGYDADIVFNEFIGNRIKISWE